MISTVPIGKRHLYFPFTTVYVYLLPQRASLKRASKAADPNFVLWVEIKIFYLAHCMTVPVNLTVVQRGQA
jgi:hypothetical protein